MRRAIDENQRVTLRGQVRGGLAQHRDLGSVEDSLSLRLFLVLKPSAAQQADLDGLLSRQQDPQSANYHKWLTPKEYGARFGLAADDTAKITRWLESRGFTVKSVLNNGSMIDFEATAGRVRDTFRTPMHYYEVNGGRYPANAQEPSIPAALDEVVSGIQGLDRFPLTPHHSAPRLATQDATTHRLSEVSPAAEGQALQPAFNSSSSGARFVGAQDFYSIYNLKPTFAGGNLGAGATVAVVEQSDMVFGSVDPVTGVATGGDVANFRSVFTVPGKLNMVVMHGAGSVTCKAPGVSSDEFEATLDAEWANAAAPSATLLYMSCDSGIIASLAALVDNNLGDVLSISYGVSEYAVSHPIDGLYQQAAVQGQSIIVSSGDSGSDAAEQNSTQAATYPSSVNVLASSPLVTALGGTDFADSYDFNYSHYISSTTYTYTDYWAKTGQAGYGTASGYIPETGLERNLRKQPVCTLFHALCVDVLRRQLSARNDLSAWRRRRIQHAIRPASVAGGSRWTERFGDRAGGAGCVAVLVVGLLAASVAGVRHDRWWELHLGHLQYRGRNIVRRSSVRRDNRADRGVDRIAAGGIEPKPVCAGAAAVRGVGHGHRLLFQRTDDEQRRNDRSAGDRLRLQRCNDRE